MTALAALSADIKERTKPHHVAAERHPLQQQVVKGTIQKHTYAAYAAQLRHIHVALEGALDKHQAGEPRLSRLFQPHCRRIDAFDADLALLDSAGAVRTVQPAAHAAAAWINSLAAAQPIALIGVLYVVEGSTNGGKFLAPILRKSWGFADGNGLESLDPHGARVHERWGQFRAGMDELSLTAQEREGIVNAAAATFEWISRSMDDVTREDVTRDDAARA